MEERAECGDPPISQATYDPPYGSPIEDRFAWAFSKYLRAEVGLEKQAETATICGTFWLDFLARVGKRRIAIECDGKEYHDHDRDKWRDALLLGDQRVDVMYRFRGRDIHHVADDCVYLLSVSESGLFTERGMINLRLLASDEIKQKCVLGEDDWGRVDDGEYITVYRRTPRFDHDDYAEFRDELPTMQVIRRAEMTGTLDSRYRYASRHRGMTLQSLIALHKKEFPKP
jgi:hypothetical protein